MTRLLKKLALFAIALFIGFIAAESFFRIYYLGRYVGVDENEVCMKQMKLDNLPSDKKGNFRNFTRRGYWQDDQYIGITLKPNYTRAVIRKFVDGNITMAAVLFTEHHHNSKGMQNIEEFSLKKPNNISIRIAMFGDSFTCGAEAPYIFGMSNMLKELVPGSEVLNFCVGGRGVETMYARYILEARNYSPDVVIFNIYMDDLVRPFGCPVMTPNLVIVDGKIVLGAKEYKSLEDFYNKYNVPKIESYFIKHLLYVYNTQTKYAKDMKKGFDLLSAILDDIKQKTEEDKARLFVTLIQERDPRKTSLDYYKKISTLLEKKKIPFLDSDKYFDAHKQSYRNQSFYYIMENRSQGHYSVIGYALHAQGLKNLLEQTGAIPSSPDYFFANFNTFDYMFLIPTEFGYMNETGVRIIYPFGIRAANYTNKGD